PCLILVDSSVSGDPYIWGRREDCQKWPQPSTVSYQANAHHKLFEATQIPGLSHLIPHRRWLCCMEKRTGVSITPSTLLKPSSRRCFGLLFRKRRQGIQGSRDCYQPNMLSPTRQSLRSIVFFVRRPDLNSDRPTHNSDQVRELFVIVRSIYRPGPQTKEFPRYPCSY